MKLLECFKKDSKARQEKQEPCPANSLKECKYGDKDECKFNKSFCHHIEIKKNTKKLDKTPWKVRGFILVGLICYILSTILSNTPEYNFRYSEYLYSILSGISISIIAGALLTYIVDIPSKLKEYEMSFLNALSSNNYLKSLDEDRLINLRKDITEQLHVKNAPFMAKGLIDFDEKICELLKCPYYTKYRHSVLCSDIPGEKEYVLKEHDVDFVLKNPYGSNKDAVEYIGFSNLILKKEGEDVGSYISELTIEYKKDKDELINVTSSYKIQSSELSNKVEYYNYKLTLTSENQEGKSGIKVVFKNMLRVRIHYKLKVPKEDVCFTKRLRHPVKNFRLDYCYNNSQVKLFGQLFGTELKQSDVDIKYMCDNNISIESFGWLLPGNGAIVVTTLNP